MGPAGASRPGLFQIPKGAAIKLLEAVNHCLSSSGKSNVSQLNDGSEHQARAQNAIATIRKDILTRGWKFNTNIVSLAVDGDGRVPVDKSYLKVGFRDLNLSLRYHEDTNQQFVWDIRENDYWGEAIDCGLVDGLAPIVV